MTIKSTLEDLARTAGVVSSSAWSELKKTPDRLRTADAAIQTGVERTRGTTRALGRAVRHGYDNLGYYALLNTGLLIGANYAINQMQMRSGEHRDFVSLTSYAGATAGVLGANALGTYLLKKWHEHRGKGPADVIKRNWKAQALKVAAVFSLYSFGGGEKAVRGFESDYKTAKSKVVRMWNQLTESPASVSDITPIEDAESGTQGTSYDLKRGPKCAEQYSDIYQTAVEGAGITDRVERRALVRVLKMATEHESDCKADAISVDGAVGPLQLMPHTAELLGLKVYMPNQLSEIYKKEKGQIPKSRRDEYVAAWLAARDIWNEQSPDSFPIKDERVDPQKGSQAGARHFLDSYKHFRNTRSYSSDEAIRFALLAHNMGRYGADVAGGRGKLSSQRAIDYGIEAYFNPAGKKGQARLDALANVEQAKSYVPLVESKGKNY